MPKIEGDGKSWLRRPKFYKRAVEPHKKKNLLRVTYCIYLVGIIVNVYRINKKLVYELAHFFAFFQVLSGSSGEYSKNVINISLKETHIK